MHSAQQLLEIGAVLLGLGLLGRLGARWGLSAIPLYLLAGLAFGEGGLLPLGASQSFIETGAEIGVVLMLLMLGLEYTPRDLGSNLRRSAPAGLADLVANGLPGAAAGLLMGWGVLGAVAMAGVTAVSSSGIVAKVLSDTGRLGNRETPAVLSVLVLEDLAMTIYLPVLTTLAAGASWLAGAKSIAVALLVLTVVLVAAVRLGPGLSRWLSSADRETAVLLLLGATLLVAGAAQRLGVSAAVGAFLVGIAVSGTAAHTARAALAPLRDVFAAVFFVFVGLSVDPAVLPAVALPALLLAAVTAATKICTGWWAAARIGVGRPGRWRAGCALIPRGEFSIVIAGLAVAGGAPPGLLALSAAYVLILAVTGPVLTQHADRTRRILLRS